MDPTCPECEKAGLESTVEMHTAMGGFGPIRPFKDWKGDLHLHDPSDVTTHYSCSNKHSWIVTEKTPCPVPGCTWDPEAGG